jgi:hypothetical protein
MTTGNELCISDPEKWLSQISSENDFVGVVIFRGSWCKFDKHYLQKLGKISKEKFSSEHLKLIAWTSEGAEGAKKADEEWSLTKDFGYSDVIGDGTCALAKYLVDDCLLEKLVTSTPEEAQVEKLVTPGTYSNGIVQPGMIWYAHKEAPSIVVLWEAVVEPPHFGGPNRPNPEDLFEQVLKRKHALEKGEAIVPVHGNQLKQCASPMDVNCVTM